MGPNGSGKSTLAYALMGHPAYEITEGQIIFDGEDLTEAGADERAQRGPVPRFQYPHAVPGVTVTNFLRSAINAIARRARAARTTRFRSPSSAMSCWRRWSGSGFARARVAVHQRRVLGR